MGATGATYCWQVRTYECGPDGFATLPDGFRPNACEVVFKAETLVGEEVRAEAIAEGDGAFLCRAIAADGRDHALASVKCKF